MERVAYADISDYPAELCDILLAGRSTCAVLITAPPDDALHIAQAVAIERRWGNRLLVCDCRAQEVPGLIELGQSPNQRILFLREVHLLPMAQQSEVMRLLDGGYGLAAKPRIIASSSVSLYDRVRSGTFNAELFYRLNMVHLTPHAAQEYAAVRERAS